jgi:hypothetical protein
MTDQPVTVEETKKGPDMTKVREGKKRKQQERDTTLSDLQSQISSMASMMKTDLKPEKPEVDTDMDPDGPLVVTRKKQKVDDDKPSIKSEIIKTAIVAVLGLMTWYVQSVAFKQKPSSVIDRIAAPVISPTPPPRQQEPSPLPPIKKKIGAHGLLE